MTSTEPKAGDKFGQWTLVEYAGLDAHNQRSWKVRCSCGTTSTRPLTKLRSGQSRSCGCSKAARHQSVMSALSGRV